MDALAIAQYISRAGLLFGGVEALSAGHTAWTQADSWQPLRRLAEDTMVVRDPVELFVAQNFAIDGLIYPIISQTQIDGVFSTRGASALSMVPQFQTDWSGEVTRWVDSELNIAARKPADTSTVPGT